MSSTDLQLLVRYTQEHAEDAFAEIVRRHLDLVFSAALRQVRSPQLAEEVAQSAFTDLARNAHRLARGSDASSPDGGSDTSSLGSLTPWLYQVTRRTAIDVVRREARRQLREQIATEMNAINETAHFAKCADTPDWINIEPLLDEAMSALDDTDRAAILLRYFENKSLREVGATLGTSDDAAQKRVSRAVERLREFFAKRGVTVGASGLVVVISANAVQAAPVGLAVTISTAAALAGTTVATTATATATKAIAMTTLQKTLVTATVAILAGAGIYEAHQTTQMRVENEALQQQLANARTDNESLSNRLVEAGDSHRLSSEQFKELLKLRGEVGILRQAANELERIKQENQRLNSQIAAQNQQSTQLSTEDEFKLNQLHWTEAMGALVGTIKTFADNHGGQYPKSFDELKAAGDLATTNLAGNLGFNDFVFLDSGTVDLQGTELILRNRTPIKTPQGILVWVYGSVNNGVPSTMITQALFGK